MDNNILFLLLNLEDAIKGKIKLRKETPEQLTKKIAKAIKDYIDGTNKESDVKPYSTKDYKMLAEFGLKGIDPVDILNSKIDPELAGDLSLAAAQFNQQLRNLIPINQSVSLLGSEDIEPSRFEQSQFVRKAQVIVHPEYSIDLLNNNMLGYLEVEMLQLFYPDLYQGLVDVTLEELALARGKGKKELTRGQNTQLSILLGVPRITPAILDEKVAETEGKEMDVSGSMTEVQEVLNR